MVGIVPLQAIQCTTIPDPDTKQPTVFLPVSVIKGVPKSYMAEWEEVDVTLLRLTFRDPKTMAMNKRYRIVRNNTGACWTSVPRSWLRNIGARQGDELVLIKDPLSEGAYLLEYREGK
jgi:hydrogenase maturation factor